jgi:beta-lactam-binding protein with PASTA domain
MLALSVAAAAALPGGCDGLLGSRHAAEPVTVPDVTTAYPAGALAILRHSGLRPRVAAVPGVSDASECTLLGVAAVSPPAGTRVDAGSVVTLRLEEFNSSCPAATDTTPAPASVEVPDVVGLELDDAVSRVSSAQLSATIVAVDHPLEELVVVDQRPHAGATRRGNSAVALYLEPIPG